MADVEAEEVSTQNKIADDAEVKAVGKFTMKELEVQASAIVERLQSQNEDVENSDVTSGGPLQADALDVDQVIKNLQELIRLDDGDGIRPAEHQLDAIGKTAVVSHSVAAFVASLEQAHLKHLATRITSDTSLWISRIFRFYEGSSFFHDDICDGLVRVVRLALHAHYPKYANDGYEALFPRPPVIYLSAAGKPGLSRYLCSQLGLPVSCLRVVAGNTMFGSHQKMDVAALERLVQDDTVSGKMPLLVVANAGTPITGHVDGLLRLQEICQDHGMWLHVEGNGLAAQALIGMNSAITRTGDSMTLTVGQWLGVPGLPYVTLYKSTEPALIHAAGLSSLNLLLRLKCLPLWITLQVLGQDGVQSRIRQSFVLTQYLEEKLQKYESVKMLSPQSSLESQARSLRELDGKALSAAALYEMAPTSVVFQYVPADADEDRYPTYLHNLNSWLGQILQRDASQLPISVLDIDGCGHSVRFCPLELIPTPSVSKQDVDEFVSCLEQQLEILDATVKHKDTFLQVVAKISQLQPVDVPQWAGLGGVRYVPSVLNGDMDDECVKHEVDRINCELVGQLRSIDSAFSQGEGEDGVSCVRFGMVTSETDVDELLKLVLATGQEIEESSLFLDKMTEIVKKGIETASEDLKRENEDRIWQEGILRQVPLVGSFVNWWSPPAKELGIKGRSLDLQAGIVESTENIYKYHMQIQQGTGDSADLVSPTTSKPPPQPLVQTSVTPTPPHSRSSSHSSTQPPSS